MRRQKLIAAIIFLLGLTASSIVWAHGSAHYVPPPPGQFRHHVQAGNVIGAPLIAPWQYRSQIPSYVYSYPPTMALPATLPAYRQQENNDQGMIDQANDPLIAQRPSAAGYYCNNPQGFYPHVRVCPKGWQTIQTWFPDS